MSKDTPKEVEVVKGQELAKIDQNTVSTIVTLKDQLEGAEAFVQMVVNSPVLSKNFNKDKDGKVDEGSVLNAIVLGHEMGIPPAAAISLGRKLDKNAYFAVIKGKSMGLDPVTSINKIYNIETKNGDVIALAVDLVSKSILDTGTSIEYIRDFMAVPMYFDFLSGIYIGHKYDVYTEAGTIKEGFHLKVGKDVTPEDKTAMGEGKIIVKRGSGLTFVTSVRLVRKENNIDQIFTYSLQEAINAGLHKGLSTSEVMQDGKYAYKEGRPNWNMHPATMLRNRVTSIGGRIVAADKLQGSYSTEEVNDMGYSTEAVIIEPTK